ncbi:MAG: hypothetical protein KJ063_01005 [Anaerolineae bacterium]|nr:hypothetical protein [Anaerolineae bacterium]
MNTFEQAVMDKLLWGDDLVLSELREQLAKAVVKERELTGTGFYLTFSLPEDSRKLTDQVPNVKSDFCFGDINAEIENLENGASFLIWVKGGKLNILEGYSYHGTWPETIEGFHIEYFSEPRDMTKLREQWLSSPAAC